MLVALGTFVASTSIRAFRQREHRRVALAVARDTTLVGNSLVQGTVRRALIPDGQEQTTPPAELRQRVSNLSVGTFINDILAEQDSALYRWPDHRTDALRVYVEPSATIAGWDPGYPQMARDVFAEWTDAGFPVHFTFIYDPATADILIQWRERFGPEEGQRIGVTERTQSSAFFIRHAVVGIANHDSAGRALSPRAVAGIVRHEVGHALGLNHANDITSVMYRESATSQIASSDRATLRLLYLLPPGSLK